MIGRTRNTLAASVGALIGILGMGPAFAQDTPQPGDAETAALDSETITVTAQRRSQDIQDVPVTVTAVSQDQLNQQNIQTTSDLVRAVPALTVTDQGVYQIRSIGTQGFGRSAEQSVSVVMDGVVLGRALTNSMYDVDHVEVLSGPQGTLFGKNANAGVVSVVTQAPQLGEYELLTHADIGFDHNYAHAYIVGNMPLGDRAALRVSYHHDSTGEVVFNTLFNEWDENTDEGIRARFLLEANENLTINLSADYQEIASNGVNGVSDFAGVQVYSFVPVGSQLEATLAACGIVASPDNNRVCANSLRAPGVDLGDTYGRRNWGGSIQVDYEFDAGPTLTSITAYRETDTSQFGLDADIAGFFGDTLPQNILDRNMVPYEAQFWSQELRIASPATDRLSYVAGIYLSETDTRDEIDQTGQLGVPLGTLEFRRFITMVINQRNYAAFGQVDYRIMPNLNVFFGARVTHDDLSDFSFNSFDRAFPAGPYIYSGNTGFFSVLPVNSCTVAGGVPYDAVLIPCPAGTSINEPAELDETGFSGTLGVQYWFSPETMVFGRIARGYKGPFINESVTYTPTLAEQPLVVDSEHATSYELGLKTTIDRFNFNVTLFHTRIDDYQTTIYVPPIPPQTVANFIQGNAPYAITEGVEATFFGSLSDNFSLSGGVLYNNAHFSEGFLVNCGTGPCEALDQLPYAPRWKATLAGEYHQGVGGGLEAFGQFDVAYSGTYFYGSTPGTPESPARYLVGLRGGLRTEDGGWGLSFFCRNCLDERYPIANVFDGFAAIDGGLLPAPGNPAPVGFPTYQFLTIDSYRVVGITLDARF